MAGRWLPKWLTQQFFVYASAQVIVWPQECGEL